MKKAFLLSALLVPMMALAEEAAPATDAPTTSTEPASSTGTAAEVKKDGAPDPKKPANALANAVQARTPEEQANQSGFQLATTLDHYIGTGTFSDPKTYASLSAFLTIQGQYLFGIGKQRLVASATLRGSYEYTLPDTETGRRWSTGDFRLGLSAPALFREKVTGIAFSPSIGLTLPTSLESWNARMIGALSLGVTMSRSVKMFDFRAGLTGAVSAYPTAFSGYRNPEQFDAGGLPKDSNGNLLVVCRPGEFFCASGGSNPFLSLSAFGQVNWRVGGSLLVYVGYQYIRAWKRGITDKVDGFTAPTLDENGNPAARVGLGNTDRTSSYIGGSYQLNEHYSLDLGLSTVQSPLFIDKDGVQRVRFPFLSFGAWNDNATSIYFTLSAAY